MGPWRTNPSRTPAVRICAVLRAKQLFTSLLNHSLIFLKMRKIAITLSAGSTTMRGTPLKGRQREQLQPRLPGGDNGILTATWPTV